MSGAPGWEAVIGLEVHAQLKTATKIFCACAADFGGAPNSRCCPVCLGLPGALPVLNRRAVELALRAALALDCRIAPVSRFARKHYFYPDLPKGYQISQYEEPLATGGHLDFAVARQAQRLRLRRLHLEEDAGKSLHGAGGTRIDLNRAGVPLVEIVSEPDLRSPAAAHEALLRLRQLLVALAVCDGSMEEGSLRCDANISLRRPGSAALGVKTELKNLNSFRGVEAALKAEIARQAARLDAGGSVEPQTLLWDPAARSARPMRGKEETEDYRYLPEPDLPPLAADAAWLASLRESLPELPAARRARFVERLGLPDYDAEVLTAEPDIADYFEQLATALGEAKLAANWVMGEVLRRAEPGRSLAHFAVAPPALADLLGRVRADELSNSAAKSVFERMVTEGGTAAEWIARLDLRLADGSGLAAQVAALIAASPRELARYRAGEAKLFGWFVGRLMAATGGRADPRELSRLLRECLDAPPAGDSR